MSEENYVTVNAEVLDAPEPWGGWGVVRLRAPMAMEVEAGQGAAVKMGVIFDCPVFLVEWEGTQQQGVRLENAGSLVLPGKEIVAQLGSKAPESALFERGDTLLIAVPLPGGFELKVNK